MQSLRAVDRDQHDQCSVDQEVDIPAGPGEPDPRILRQRHQDCSANDRTGNRTDATEYRDQRYRHRQREHKDAGRVNEQHILGIETASKSYNSAIGAFEGMLLPGARKFVELGAKGAKELPEPGAVETAPRDVLKRT